MSRTGITKLEVFDVASKLYKNLGKTPTVDLIRESLGTGSRTTINNHLKEWKKAHEDKTLAGMPAHFVKALKTVYEKIKAESDDQIEKNRIYFNQLNDNLQGQLEEKVVELELLQKTNQLLAKTKNELAKDIDDTNAVMIETNQLFAVSREANIRLEAHNQHLQKDSTHRNEEILSLNQEKKELIDKLAKKELDALKESQKLKLAEDELTRKKQKVKFLTLELLENKTNIKKLNEKIIDLEKQLELTEIQNQEIKDNTHRLELDNVKLSSELKFIETNKYQINEYELLFAICFQIAGNVLKDNKDESALLLNTLNRPRGPGAKLLLEKDKPYQSLIKLALQLEAG